MENTTTQKQELESPEAWLYQNTSRSLIENAPMGILITDQDGHCIVINAAMSELTGYSEVELLSMHSSAIIYTGNDEKSKNLLARLAEFEDSPAEVNGIHKNGTTSSWLVDAMRLTVNRNMYFIRVNCGHKNATDTVCHNETWYKSLFENGHAVMMLVHPTTGEIIQANTAACDYYGWSQSELIGKNIAEINCLTPDEIKSEMQLALKNNKNVFSFRHRLVDGEVRDVEVYSGPVNISGSKLLYSMVHDVTAQKAAEEELKIKSQMLEKQNKNFIGREQKMIALKMEINDLLRKLGSSEKYRIPYRTDFDLSDESAANYLG